MPLGQYLTLADDRALGFHRLRTWHLAAEPAAAVAAATDAAAAYVGAKALAARPDQTLARFLPEDLTIRHGDLGELLAAALYRDRIRDQVPIQKLRRKHVARQPLPGPDVLVARVDRAGSAATVAVEAKARSGSVVASLVAEAVDSLAGSLATIDDAKRSTVDVAHEAGEPLAATARLDSIFESGFLRHGLVFVGHALSAAAFDDLDTVWPDDWPPGEIDVILLDDLPAFGTEVADALGALHYRDVARAPAVAGAAEYLLPAAEQLIGLVAGAGTAGEAARLARELDTHSARHRAYGLAAAAAWYLAGYEANAHTLLARHHSGTDRPRSRSTPEPPAGRRSTDPTTPDITAPTPSPGSGSAPGGIDVPDDDMVVAIVAELIGGLRGPRLEVPDCPRLTAALGALRTYHHYGDEGGVRDALGELDATVVALADEGRDHSTYALRLGVAVVRRQLAASPWRLIPPHQRPPGSFVARTLTYQASTGSRPVRTLWPAQDDAIAAGALDPGVTTIVARMPTTAGKSHLAPLLIAHGLDQGPDAVVVYLASTRALARETAHTLDPLRRALHVAPDAAGALDYSAEEFRTWSSQRLIVTTPEKFDLMVRRDHHRPPRRARTRGARRSRPGTLNDADQIEDIDDQASDDAGLADLYSDDSEQLGDGTPPEDAHPAPPGDDGAEPDEWEPVDQDRERWTPRISAVIVDEAHLLADTGRGARLELLLGRLQRTNPDTRIVLLSSQTPNVEDLARWLSHRPDTGDGPLAVVNSDWRPTLLVRSVLWPDPEAGVAYYQHEDWAKPQACLDLSPGRRGADLFSELEHPLDTTDDALVGAVVDIKIGDGLVLVYGATVPDVRRLHRAISVRLRDRRIGLHHARLPDAERHAVEDAARAGELAVVVCTSTLAEGINLPVRTVVIATRYWGNEEVPRTTLANLEGRAGRAFRYEDGEALYVCSDKHDADTARRRWRDDPTPTKTGLTQLLEGLASARTTAAADELVQSFDSELLFLLVEESAGPDSIDWAERLLSTTLWGLDASRPERARVARWLRKRHRFVNQHLRDRPLVRAAYLRSGLSFSSCSQIIDYYDTFGGAALARAYDERVADPESSSWQECVRVIVAAAFRTRELTAAAMATGLSRGEAEQIVLAWVAGLREHDIEQRRRSTGRAKPWERFRTQTTLPWVVHGAASLLVAWMHDEPDGPDAARFDPLPTMVTAGVPGPVEAAAFAVGATRDEALTLGPWFPDGLCDPARMLAWLAGGPFRSTPALVVRTAATVAARGNDDRPACLPRCPQDLDRFDDDDLVDWPTLEGPARLAGAPSPNDW